VITVNYIDIVNDAMRYIESNLHRKLSLDELSSRHYISSTYFQRIFRAVTNHTVKSYILGRKLSEAAIALRETERNVTDIAFNYGFSSHEQFTRNFIKMFHIAPNRYRKEKIYVPLTERVDIVERDFKNVNKDIIVDYHCREIKEIKILGQEMFFRPENTCELEEAIRRGNNYEEEYFIKGTAGRLFNVIRFCNSDDLHVYCFSGIPAEEYIGDSSSLEERIIPASKYAVLSYPDIIGLIYRTVRDDLYRWLNVSKLSLNKNAGIDMFILQNKDYGITRKIFLHVPVL